VVVGLLVNHKVDGNTKDMMEFQYILKVIHVKAQKYSISLPGKHEE
jgi:hypothetical protein